MVFIEKDFVIYRKYSFEGGNSICEDIDCG